MPSHQHSGLDRLLSYKTFKVVRIRDRYLGLLFWLMVSIVLVYVIVFALIFGKKHLETVNGVGSTEIYYNSPIHLTGANIQPLIYKAIEPSYTLSNEILIPKKVKMSNIETNARSRYSSIQITSSIKFSATSVFSSSINIDIDEGLRRLVEEEHIHLDGKIITIGINVKWDCDFSFWFSKKEDCSPDQINVNFLSASSTPIVNDENVLILEGIRIISDTQGKGSYNNFIYLMTQIGSALALIKTASIVCDFIMLNLYSKVRRDLYYECKVVETEDFSDLRDRINVI